MITKIDHLKHYSNRFFRLSSNNSTKTCLFLASITYLLFDLAFLYPMKYALTIVSIINGFAAGVLWVSQGKFIADNSNAKTIDQNTSIFWSIYQGSLVFGNLYFYFKFDGVEKVDSPIRIQTYTVLSFVNLLGCISFLFLKGINQESIEQSGQSDALTAFKNYLKLFITKKV